MAIEKTVTDAERADAIAALRNAKESIEKALFQLQNRDETVIPTMVLSYIRDAEAWEGHAKNHLAPAQLRYNLAGLPSSETK